MKVFSTKLPEVKIIEYDISESNRGYSYPIYDRIAFEKEGIKFAYNYENVYYSAKAGTLYGIHFQNNPMAQC